LIGKKQRINGRSANVVCNTRIEAREQHQYIGIGGAIEEENIRVQYKTFISFWDDDILIALLV